MPATLVKTKTKSQRNNMLPSFVNVEDRDEKGIYSLLPPPSYRAEPNLQRIFDIVVSILLLMLSLPLMLLIMILVKIDSTGPVFYSQVRVGVNRRKRRGGRVAMRKSGLIFSHMPQRNMNLYGKPFKVYKFRSMKIDAEKNGQPVWCQANDPRITRLGWILRKMHLDELPQLINILKGEMSLVGPRPERPEIVLKLRDAVPGYEERLWIKPGVTGLAQTRHRADLEMGDVRKKIKYDLFYMRKKSFLTNLKIILETIPLSLGVSAAKFKEWRRKNSLLKEVRTFIF